MRQGAHRSCVRRRPELWRRDAGALGEPDGLDLGDAHGFVHGTSDERAAIDGARAYAKLLQDKGKTVETLYVDGEPQRSPVQVLLER